VPIQFPTAGINFDLSRAEVENLLAGFLTGAQGVELGTRLTDLRDLPAACRARVQSAEDSGHAWAAWSTPTGPIAAWGQYDVRTSRELFAYQLLIQWWDVPSGHHALWCYCGPKRPTEWTIGRGRHPEPG
jgi:hypothetical protein